MQDVHGQGGGMTMAFVGTGEEHIKAVRYALGYCADNLDRLTDWEQDFIESVTDQFERSGHLSEKQEDVLERIYCNLP